MPQLSIITINLNNEDGLHNTIKSVESQTYKNFEYIIIDGGSTDGSVQLIKDYSHALSYWVSEPDSGIYNAMNKGILKAKGDYLLFLNSGDWLVNDSVISSVFDLAPKSDLIYGHMNFVSKDGIVLRKAANEDELTFAYFFYNSFCHPATFISRRLFNGSLFDENFKIAADKKFFIEKVIYQNCSLLKIDKIITNFDLNGLSNKSENKGLIEEENERILNIFLPPRFVEDIKLYKNNYYDIQSLIKIKKNRLTYFFFIMLKKALMLLR